jgi:hypothetical protein
MISALQFSGAKARNSPGVGKRRSTSERTHLEQAARGGRQKLEHVHVSEQVRQISKHPGAAKRAIFVFDRSEPISWFSPVAPSW